MRQAHISPTAAHNMKLTAFQIQEVKFLREQAQGEMSEAQREHDLELQNIWQATVYSWGRVLDCKKLSIDQAMDLIMELTNHMYSFDDAGLNNPSGKRSLANLADKISALAAQ